MNQSTLSNSAVPTPIVSSSPKGRAALVCRWLRGRLVAAAVTGFLVAFVTALVIDDGSLTSLLKKRVLVQGGWLLNFDLTIRWGRVWGFGILLGLCLPNVQLPEWLKRVLLSSLIGMPVAIAGLGMMDSVLAANAVDLAYAPFPDAKLNPEYARPQPGYPFYPSVYREWFARTLIAGCGCGSIVGCVWAASGIKQKVLAVIAAMAVVGVTVEAWSQASVEFDSYVQSQQKAIRDRIGGAHAE
ncbi:MAG: hypothetical protein NT013_26670 [Planctomycetia bacterium]|nr:hypothetical protein [Planctomycetia bacterium]